MIVCNRVAPSASEASLKERGTLLMASSASEKIVGTAISCEFTYLIGPGTFVPDPEHFGVFYVKQEFAEEVFDLEGAANQIVGRFAPGEKMGKESLRQAETLLDSYGVLQVTPLKLQSSNQFLTGEIDQIGTFATIFPTIFLIVAALVLNVLMLRLARQQRTVIGTLKAIGYSDRQVFLHFLKFGLIVGLIAGLLGGVGGYFDSLLMTTMYSWFFQFPNLRNEFSGQAYAIGIGLALSCSWIGSWYGSRAALALPPAQAMRPEPPRQGRAILLERATWLWGRLNASWRMTARNLFRNRLRTGMGIFSATMGASLMINGFMLVEATRFMIDFHFFRLSTSDIDLAFDEEQGIEAIDELKHLPGVDLAEPALAVSCNLKHGPYQRKTVLTGLLPQPQLTTPRDTAGEKLRVPDDGVLLTQRLADLLHARRGDRITMVPVKGGRRPIELQVVEIGDSYIGISAYANIHTLSRAVEEELVVTGAQLKTDGDRMHLDSLYREFKRMPGIQAVNSRHDLITNLVQTLITNQRVMISVIVTFAGIVFLGSITNASLISLGERLSEVATLRAIGYGPWQVGNLFLRESLITTLLGVCFGLPGGYWLTWLMTASYENEMLKIPLVSAAWVWQAAFLLAVVFTLAAHCIVQISIHWMNVPDTLKAKE